MTSILVAALVVAASSPTAALRAPEGRLAIASPAFRAVVAIDDDSQTAEQTVYARATAALDRGEFDAAATAFSEAAALKGERADSALYWSAYAHNKRGRRDEALKAISELRANYPKSRWLRDARALEVEIRQATGQAPAASDGARPYSWSRGGEGDEDLKLLALGGIMNADPDRALPIVEQMLSSTQSDKVRDRALFVLAQSGSPKAREVLVRIARTGADEETQARAIRYLGMFGGQDSRQALVDIYKASQSQKARKAVLNAFMLAGDRAALVEVAKSEQSPALRREAIHQIGVSGGRDELWQLYQTETAPEVKDAILNGLFISGASDQLAELAKKETDPRLRREAIQKLGLTGSEKSGAMLKQMYSSEKDIATKRTILNAFFIQGNATTLVEIARAEQDPSLKREAVQKLSLMNAKEATEYMMELLK